MAAICSAGAGTTRGQLGLGEVGKHKYRPARSPGLDDVEQVSVSRGHCCAVTQKHDPFSGGGNTEHAASEADGKVVTTLEQVAGRSRGSRGGQAPLRASLAAGLESAGELEA